VALVPVFLLAAFAAGEAGYAALGYAPENADAPAWVVVVVSTLVVIIAAIPCAAAVLYGRRCLGSGDRRGILPLVIGALVLTGVAALTIVSEVGNAVRG
jgi:hypothetical protein